jgi:hypothetical protein
MGDRTGKDSLAWFGQEIGPLSFQLGGAARVADDVTFRCSEVVEVKRAHTQVDSYRPIHLTMYP